MRTLIIAVGISACIFHGQRTEAQAIGMGRGFVVHVHHRGTTVQSAYNDSLARREVAAARRDYYEALADHARAKARREGIAANVMTLRSLQADPGVFREGSVAIWPAPLDAPEFAADRDAADRLLVAWTVSGGDFRTVDKQRLRVALVNMRLKLKRLALPIEATDAKTADDFLNNVARTALGPRAGLD